MSMDLEQRTSPHPGDHDGEPDLPTWGYREVLIGIGVAVVALVLILTVSTPIVGAQGDSNSAGALLVGVLASLAFELALFGIAAAFTAGAYPGGLELLGWRPRRPGSWLQWTGLALVIAYVALYVYVAITSLPGLHSFAPQQNVPTDLFKHRQTEVLAILLTVVFAPVCEESFFRGFMFNGLRRRVGTPQAATFSGLLFALAHFQPSLIIPFTIIGVGFAYAYRRTGTLWANVLAHAAFNGLSVVATIGGFGGSIWLGHLLR